MSGVGGSEKGDFFRDAEMIAALNRAGWGVSYEESGSRTLAVLKDRTYDFAFPAGTAAEEKIRNEPTAFNKPFSSQQFLTFSSLLVIGTFKEIADTFVSVGVARREDRHTVLDIRKYLDEIALPRRRWSDFPTVGRFSSPYQILIATTDPRESNSAAAFISLMSFVLNKQDLVSEEVEADRILPVLTPMFADQGDMPPSTDDLFEKYTGPTRWPLVAVYESQFLQRQVNSPNLLPEGWVMMHTDPPLLTDHAVVPFTPNGFEVAKVLGDDPTVQGLAVRYGYRTRVTSQFTDFYKEREIAVRDSAGTTVRWPRSNEVEYMIGRISR